MENFKQIIKEEYEKKYGTQIYEKSPLKGTFEDVVLSAMTRVKLLFIPDVINWVAIKDMLPENETKLYLVVRDGVVMTETWYYRDKRGFWYNYLGITHWMQLLEPPCL